MTTSTTTAVMQEPKLTDAEKQALIAFKHELNEKLPTIVPETKEWGKLVHETDIVFDAGFQTLLDRFILNEDLIKKNAALQPLVAKYNALSENIRTPIALNRSFFVDHREEVSLKPGEQQQAVINLGQDYLNIPHTSDNKIDQNTAFALKERLKVLQAENPDIRVDFVPQGHDERTIAFLDKLLEKRMAEAGITATTLNSNLIGLWAKEQADKTDPDAPASKVGEIVALKNMVQLTIDGALPSGASSKPASIDAPWDKRWTNNISEDRFFSPQTYAMLVKNYEVLTSVMFAKTPDNPDADLLKTLAKKAGLDVDKESFNTTEIGKLAVEVLSYRAKELGIEDQDVNKAIHTGRYMPHLDDLKLTECAFHTPDLSYGQETWEAESKGFAARFGTIDSGFLRSLGNDPMHVLEFKPDVHQAPGSYFKTYRGFGGNGSLRVYEYRRENEYLPRLAEFRFDDKTKAFGTPKAETKPKTDTGVPAVDKLLDEAEKRLKGSPEETVKPVGGEETAHIARDAFSLVAAHSATIEDRVLAITTEVTGQASNATVEKRVIETQGPTVRALGAAA